jgi:acyl carrier protein
MAITTDVSNKIIQALAEYLKRDAASITPTHHLREDLGLDSMAVIEMLYRIEEVFNLQIPDEDLVGLTTVGHVIDYVQGRVAPAPAKTAAKTPAKTAARKPAAKRSTKSKKA